MVRRVGGTALARMTPQGERRLEQMSLADLPPLASLTNVERLFLTRTPITDVTPLEALTQLRVLGLRLTRVRHITPLAALTNPGKPDPVLHAG